MRAIILERLRSDQVIYWSLILGSIGELIFGLVLLINFRALPPLVPLLYSLPWGQGQLVSWWVLPILFLAGLGALIAQAMLTLVVLEKEILLARIIMAGGAISVILMATTATKIILLTHF